MQSLVLGNRPTDGASERTSGPEAGPTRCASRAPANPSTTDDQGGRTDRRPSADVVRRIVCAESLSGTAQMEDKIVYCLIGQAGLHAGGSVPAQPAGHGVTSSDNNIKAALSTRSSCMTVRFMRARGWAFRKILRDRNKGLYMLHESVLQSGITVPVHVSWIRVRARARARSTGKHFFPPPTCGFI